MTSSSTSYTFVVAGSIVASELNYNLVQNVPTIDISIRQEYISNHISGDATSNGVPLLDNQALNLDVR